MIPENVRNIGDNAFRGCYSLEKVTFPSVLKNIGSGAFASCGSLKKLQFQTESAALEAVHFPVVSILKL